MVEYEADYLAVLKWELPDNRGIIIIIIISGTLRYNNNSNIWHGSHNPGQIIKPCITQLEKILSSDIFCSYIRPLSKNKRHGKDWQIPRSWLIFDQVNEQENDGDTNRSWWSWISQQRTGKESWDIRDKEESRPSFPWLYQNQQEYESYILEATFSQSDFS